MPVSSFSYLVILVAKVVLFSHSGDSRLLKLACRLPDCRFFEDYREFRDFKVFKDFKVIRDFKDIRDLKVFWGFGGFGEGGFSGLRVKES